MNNLFLDTDQLKKLIPSAFSQQAHEQASGKYGFIPTSKVIEGLSDAGFYPTKASQTCCRNAENQSFTKHMIRFRRKGLEPVNGIVPEIILINSHDCTTSYQIRGGAYRFVCSNGLIVGTDLFTRKIKHQGDVTEKVIDSASDIIEIFPKAVKIANEWKSIELSPNQKEAFAESAMLLKWPNKEIELKPTFLLTPRRDIDCHDDLWTTFNVIQENIIRGGLRYRTPDAHRPKNRTRPVNSVSENVRLNTALWCLTEKMAELCTK